MKIQDLEHFCFDKVNKVQGGLSAASPESGLVISNEDGRLTIFKDGIELFSDTLESPIQGISLRLKGSPSLNTRCEARSQGGNTISTCQVSFGPIAVISRVRPRFFFPF